MLILLAIPLLLLSFGHCTQAASLQSPVNSSYAVLGLQLATNFTSIQAFQTGLATSFAQALAIRDAYVASIVNGNNVITGYELLNSSGATAVTNPTGNPFVVGYVTSQTIFTAIQTNPTLQGSTAAAGMNFGGMKSAFVGRVFPSLAFRVQNASLLVQASNAGNLTGMLSAIQSVIPYLSFDDFEFPSAASQSDLAVANALIRYRVLFPVEVPVTGNSTYVNAIQNFNITFFGTISGTTAITGCFGQAFANGAGPLGSIVQIINSGVTVNDGDVLYGGFCQGVLQWTDSTQYLARFVGLSISTPGTTMDLSVATTTTAQTVPVQALAVQAPTAAPTVAPSAAPTVPIVPTAAPTAVFPTGAPTAVLPTQPLQTTAAVVPTQPVSSLRASVMSALHLTSDTAKVFMGAAMAVFLLIFVGFIVMAVGRARVVRRYVVMADKDSALIQIRTSEPTYTNHSFSVAK